MQGFSVADQKPSNKHIQINDLGTAGWEVQITYRSEADGTPDEVLVRRLIYKTYKMAKFAAQSLAVGL
jgi:hypothetical protein